MVYIIGIDQRGLRYKIGYYKSIESAKRWFDRVVNDKYWKNYNIQFVETFIENEEDW